MTSTKIQHSITEVAKVEKIVDYSFERSDKSNVLAIHPTRPLIAYLINIQRTQKISKAWSSGNDSCSSINGHNTTTNQNNTVSIRVIDYVTRQRCLAKGIYHARPADCVFIINSLLCSQADVIKLAVVDRLANIYLYDLSYFINDLTATRIAVIRAPAQEVSPYESINLVWCPFVPCEDFDDGDGGLRLALATNTKIEIFAIDRLQGRTGELLRSELKGAYKCIQDAHKTPIATLSISPDCSTISAAALDNRVTFFSSDIDDSGQRCLHNWEASVTDRSSISKLFFLDDYPKLLEDSTMKFWGTAFIGTKNGQMLLVDLRTWSVYQRMNINSENLDYRIDLTSRNVIATNGNQLFVVQIEHSDGLPRIARTTKLGLHNPIYSFVIKHKSDEELELFTISAFSLERYIINLEAINVEPVEPIVNTPQEVTRFLQQFDGSLRMSSGGLLNDSDVNNKNQEIASLDVNQMDKMVEALFTKLNTAFSQGLDEFLNDVKCEVNDLKLKLNGLCRDVRKLQQQLQETRQK